MENGAFARYGICASMCVLNVVWVFSCMRSVAYSFRVSYSVLVSTFFALAKISRQISLKTKSAQLVLASSINSLQALSNTSFILLTEELEEAFLVLMLAIL
jgi:hypothetical protein